MDTIFENQYPGQLWDDLINAESRYRTYATCYQGPNPMTSLDYFVNNNTSAVAVQEIPFPQDLQAELFQGEQISNPVYIDQAHQQQLPEVQDFNVSTEEKTSGIEEVKTQLEQISRYHEREGRSEQWVVTDTGDRQIDKMNQHLAALHPYFHAMRSTLKALTEQVNRQWEVTTPVTPCPRRRNTSSIVASEAASRTSEVLKASEH